MRHARDMKLEGKDMMREVNQSVNPEMTPERFEAEIEKVMRTSADGKFAIAFNGRWVWLCRECAEQGRTTGEIHLCEACSEKVMGREAQR